MQRSERVWKIQSGADLPHHPRRTRLHWYFSGEIGFLTSYEVKILQTANLGTLVDKLNRREGVAIQKLEWKDA